MSNFDEIFSTFAARFPGVSPELRPLLADVYEEIVAEDRELARVKAALVRLLEYLSSEEGRTDRNCQAVDYLFLVEERWEPEWLDDGLPQAYIDILCCGALDDAVSAPQIAESFGCNPEQLLEEARNLPT